MGISCATLRTTCVGSISIIIVIGRTAIAAMNIGSASAGVSCAAIGSISIAGAGSSIISACTRGHIDSRWGRRHIDRSRGNIDRRARNYQHATRTCKKPRAGRQ
jgi:hypothetical protein